MNNKQIYIADISFLPWLISMAVLLKKEDLTGVSPKEMKN